MQITTAITQYINYLRNEVGYSPDTVRMYEYNLNRFVTFLAEFTKKPIEELLVLDLTRESIRSFKSKVLDIDKLTPKSLNLFLVSIRSLLSYLERHDIECLSREKVEKMRKVEDKGLHLIEKDALKKFLKAKENPRSDLIVNMLFCTGMRVSELAARNIEDINSDQSISIIGKGNKRRIVFLSATVSKMLKDYVKDRKSGPIFLNEEGKAISPRTIERIVDNRAEYYLPKGTHFTPHTLRHHYATDLLEQGAPLHIVKELLGHTNINTTMRYTHFTNKDLKEAHRNFHSRV
jgi:site-specific recombinase XerD